jgi:hypothetical protein
VPVDIGIVGVWIAFVNEFMVGLVFSEGLYQDLFSFPAYLLLPENLRLSLLEIKLQTLYPDLKTVILFFEGYDRLDLGFTLFRGVFVLFDQ